MRSKNNPRISLCIPNYNRALDLLNVIEDCKNQTTSPYEIVIQDDKSDPAELGIIKKKLVLDKNMSFSINKKNLGLVGNINAVIKNAHGDYLAIVHNDDRLSPYYVEEIVKAVNKFPSLNIYTTNGMAINEDGEIIGDYRLSNKSIILKKHKGIARLWKYYFLNLITISGITIYKTRFIKKNLFNVKFGNEADLDRALKFLSTQDIVYIDKPIYYVRLHRDQVSTKIRLNKKDLESYIRRCFRIYSSYRKQFKNVPLYMSKIKGVYFLQLAYKYKYGIKRIKKLLDISSNKELSLVLGTIFLFLMTHFLKMSAFRFHYKKYLKYFPQN